MTAEMSAYRDKEKQPDPITVSDVFPYFFQSEAKPEPKPIESLSKRERAVLRLEHDLKSGMLTPQQFGQEMKRLERKGASNGH